MVCLLSKYKFVDVGASKPDDSVINAVSHIMRHIMQYCTSRSSPTLFIVVSYQSIHLAYFRIYPSCITVNLIITGMPSLFNLFIVEQLVRRYSLALILPSPQTIRNELILNWHLSKR